MSVLFQSSDLKVDLEDRHIVVRMPDTSFRATYMKSPDAPGLIQSDFMTDDNEVAISRNEFLAMAWKAAHAKASP